MESNNHPALQNVRDAKAFPTITLTKFISNQELFTQDF